MGLIQEKYFVLFLSTIFVVESIENSTWTHFVFTQQWPTSACIEGNATKHDCEIPSNVTTWTIHGLWPDDPNEHEGPAFCNSSWKFDERKIEILENKLKKYWPNLYETTASKYTEFWAHEWDKHGTCCTDLPATANEYYYFSQGLLLNEMYNITQLLNQHNMLPGNNYTLSTYEEVFTKALGFVPNIQCVINKTKGEEETQFIYQVEICLSKHFSVIKCPQSDQLRFKPQQSPGFGPARNIAINAGMCSSHKLVQYPYILH